MTLSTTINKVSYSGTGSQDTFAYTYKIFSSSDIEVYIRNTLGTETKKTITTHYTVSNVGNASGGNIVFTTGNTPLNTDTVIIVRTVPLTQTFDYVLNDPFPSDSHEDGLDKLTMQVQQVKEEVDRSIKASVTNTIASTEFTQSSTDRANKLFGFDSSGNLTISTTLGTNRGNWGASTIYSERDIVKDTSTNNIFQINSGHTSSGSQPLTTNANSAKYTLLVDAATATTKASEASASASAASSSATASASSATAAAASLDSFDDKYLGAKGSAPSTDNDGNALANGALYWNTSSNLMHAWNGSAWVALADAASVASSATSASSSASSATTSKNAAASSATASANSASTASGHKDTANTKAGEAATSATASASSASTASGHKDTATTKANEAAASATAAGNSATAGANSATASANSATSAASAVTQAANSATTAAANSATAAASSATSAASSLDSFDDRYLGAKGSAPSTDNDGDALLTGALYFNTSSNQLFVWTSGDAWTQAAFTASGFLSSGNNLSDVANAGTSRTNLGLAIGTHVQAFDADLSALAGLTSAADKGIQFTGSGAAGVYNLTAAGKALLDDADAAAQRTTLGLGTAATTATTAYATSAQGTKADNAAAKASNLSDLASASTARSNLGLGTAATLTAGTSANNAVQLDGNSKLPAVDGSQLTGLSSGIIPLTAKGSIAAGKPVSLISSGTDSGKGILSTKGINTTATVGSISFPDGESTDYRGDDSTSVARTEKIIYGRHSGNVYFVGRRLSYQAVITAGTINTSTHAITWGTTVVVGSTSGCGALVECKNYEGETVVVWTGQINTNVQYAVYSVSGTSLSNVKSLTTITQHAVSGGGQQTVNDSIECVGAISTGHASGANNNSYDPIALIMQQQTSIFGSSRCYHRFAGFITSGSSSKNTLTMGNTQDIGSNGENFNKEANASVTGGLDLIWDPDNKLSVVIRAEDHNRGNYNIRQYKTTATSMDGSTQGSEVNLDGSEGGYDFADWTYDEKINRIVGLVTRAHNAGSGLGTLGFIVATNASGSPSVTKKTAADTGISSPDANNRTQYVQVKYNASSELNFAIAFIDSASGASSDKFVIQKLTTSTSTITGQNFESGSAVADLIAASNIADVMAVTNVSSNLGGFHPSTMVAIPTSGMFVMAWRGPTGNNYAPRAAAFGLELFDHSTTFVGVAQNSVSDGQTVNTKSLGQVDAQQSSLTIGGKVYIDTENSAITATSTNNSEIGSALSASSFIVTKVFNS